VGGGKVAISEHTTSCDISGRQGLVQSCGQEREQPPFVGIIIPVRNSQRTICQAVEALLQQRYEGRFAIWIVGNTEDQDATWQALEKIDGLLDHPQITCIKITRPTNWFGRDANLKRLRGCEAALQAGASLFALIDSQVFAPPDWLASAVSLICKERVDGIAGISRRHPDDKTLSGIYQDHSLFSEWPRYGSRFFLTHESFGRAPGLPITASLILSRRAFSEIRGTWPDGCTHGWEDFLLAWRIVSRGFTILCTDTIWVHRNHKRKFRLAKQLSAGSGAYQFYQDNPDCLYARRLIHKAIAGSIGFLVVVFTLLLMPFTSRLQGLPVPYIMDGFTSLLLCGFLCLGIASAIKARNWLGLCFPLLDVLHIAIWIGGALYVAIRRGHTNSAFARFLIQYR